MTGDIANPAVGCRRHLHDREGLSHNGPYDTGMRVQFIPNVKNGSGLTPKEAVAVNIRKRKESEKVLRECPPEEFGLFTRICIETTGYPVKSKPKQKYHLISAFWWSDQLDLIAGVTFGAPVEEWESVRSVYDISGNIKIYDDAWVRAHAANGAGGEASKSGDAPSPTKGSIGAPATPQQQDTGLDAVVKVGSIQFVNRMEDLQWRLGTNPDALIASIQAMRGAIAEENQVGRNQEAGRRQCDAGSSAERTVACLADRMGWSAIARAKPRPHAKASVRSSTRGPQWSSRVESHARTERREGWEHRSAENADA